MMQNKSTTKSSSPPLGNNKRGRDNLEKESRGISLNGNALACWRGCARLTNTLFKLKILPCTLETLRL